MPTRDSRDPRWLLRAGSGVAFLLAGLIVVTVGGAGFLSGLFQNLGTPVGTAQTVGFAIAGLVPPVVLVFVTRTVSADRSVQRTVAAGATLAGGSAVVAGFVGGPAVPGSPLTTLLAGGYGLGSLLAFGGLLVGISAERSGRGSTGADVSWQATTTRRSRSQSGVAPADGGSTDSELSFPLDPDGEDDQDDGK